MKCSEYVRLEKAVNDALQALADCTQEQLSAFRAGNQDAFMRLDKKLENAVGAKERTIGALNQHAKEHKCKAA